MDQVEPLGQKETEAPPTKKKIKLVISDLHLGKGRTLADGGTNPLEEFYYGDRLVEFFHYYSSGQFQDFEVELISIRTTLPTPTPAAEPTATTTTTAPPSGTTAPTTTTTTTTTTAH